MYQEQIFHTFIKLLIPEYFPTITITTFSYKVSTLSERFIFQASISSKLALLSCKRLSIAPWVFYYCITIGTFQTLLTFTKSITLLVGN